MIFYHATDVDGRLHLCATQAEARIINKQFEKVDVPTDKADLQKFVQQLYDDLFFARRETSAVEGTLAATVPEPELPEGVPQSTPTAWAEEKKALAPPEPALDPLENVANLNPNQLAPLVESTVSRLGELGEEGFYALDSYQDDLGVGGAFSRGVHLLSLVAAGEHQLTRILFRARKARKWG